MVVVHGTMQPLYIVRIEGTTEKIGIVLKGTVRTVAGVHCKPTETLESQIKRHEEVQVSNSKQAIND